MKLNKKDFREFILSETKKVSEEDGLSLVLKESSIIEEEDFLSSTEFEKVDPSEFENEVEEAKMLSEELTRMKELLSFNNPLLKSLDS